MHAHSVYWLKHTWHSSPESLSPKPWKMITAALPIFYHFHLFVDWHVFSSFPDPEHPDSETTEMFAQSWNIYLKVALPWRALLQPDSKSDQKKQTNTIFTSPSYRYAPENLSASFSLGMVTTAESLGQRAGLRVYSPFKFTGQTGKEGKCQKLQIKQLILKGNEACKWIIFRYAVSDFLNICHSCVVAQRSVC